MKEAAAVSIAPAQEVDLAVILGLIKELAEYENLSHQVVATEALERLATAVAGEIAGPGSSR